LWHEFAQTVHLEEKKAEKGFFHPINKFLITLPIGLILLVLGIITLVAAIMAVAPIAKLFGYDLASWFARIQAKYQDKFRPSMWLPCFSDKHSTRQKWTSITPAQDVFKQILQAVKGLQQKQKESGGEVLEIVETDQKNMKMKVHVFSPKMKCLDVVEIKCDVGEEDMGGATVDASSFSTGAGPLSLPPPFGLLSSMSLFWLPFSDSGKNKKRLDDIRSAIRSDVQLVTGETDKSQ